MDELVRWLSACLDEDALWATEASRRYSAHAVEGGAHWQWEDSDTDEIITPDPGREEVVGGESFRVSLRSKETWPTHSVGELPQFAIPTAEEVPSAVGGHIVRWDPARVLQEIAAKRDLLAFAKGIHDHHATFTTGVHARLEKTLRLYALAYKERPGYRAEWAPAE